MDNLVNLEEKVMLLVQSLRKCNDEKGQLAAEIERKTEELEAAAQEKEELQQKIEELRALGTENEVLRTKQEEARVRVEQILAKLAKFESELDEGDSGQTELMSEDAGT
jgi:septation ring formation regulator EzrA